MSLLPSGVAPNPGGYYFAASTGGGGATAPGFVANGSGGGSGFAVSVAGSANFVAIAEDTTGGGYPAFVIKENAGIARWATGVTGVEPGVGNGGSDFTLFAYNDTGGFLNSPIAITRATGQVNMNSNPGGLVVGGTTVVGAPGTVGGGILNINGTLGPSRVNDPVYNPALAPQTAFVQQNNVAFPAVIPAGISNYAIGPVVQVPTTGMYIITGSVGYDGAPLSTFTCGSGDFCQIIMVPTPVAPGVLTGGATFDFTPVPASATQIDRSWTASQTDLLTGLYNYQPTLYIYNLSNTMAASAGSSLSAGYDIVALC
jgi:hypothetical protein